MKTQYADITNKTTLLKIFQEPEFESLQISFFDAFLGFQLEKGNVDSLAFDNNFLAKGAFNDDLEIMGIDFSVKKFSFISDFWKCTLVLMMDILICLLIVGEI